MAKRPEQRAAQLLDEYLDAIATGRRPDITDIVARCPESEREGLRSAIDGATFILNNYEDVLAPPELVEKAGKRIAALNRRQRLVIAARDRLSTQDAREPLTGDAVIPFLRDVLSLGEQAQRPSAAGRPAPAMYRGRQAEGPPREALDAVRLAAAMKAAADRAGQLWIRSGAPAPPVDPTRIAERLDIVVVERKTEGCDGCVLAEGEVGGILVNASVRHEGRRRFTVAHEIGHFELHRHLWPSICESLREIEGASGELDDAGVRQREAEANAFASELLMPSSHVKREFSQKEPSFWAIDGLAERYRVSTTAAARRLVELSDFACALLYTADGRIKWFAKSKEFQYFLAVGGPPPRYSEAAALCEGAAAEDKFVISQADWWAPEDPKAEDAEILEHSRLVYGEHVLTLLYAKGLAG